MSITTKATRMLNRRFRDEDGFVPFRVAIVGSFISLRCQGSIPTKLAYDVAEWFRDQQPEHGLVVGEMMSNGWHMGGTVICFEQGDDMAVVAPVRLRVIKPSSAIVTARRPSKIRRDGASR